MISIVRSPELGQVLDVILASSAILTLAFYHVWYYSWRFTNLVEGRGYHRVDITGQRARVRRNMLLCSLFTLNIDINALYFYSCASLHKKSKRVLM